MSRILTAEEFVTLVLAKIKLMGAPEIVLETAAIDQRFEAAYNWLTGNEDRFEFTWNFTFRCDPLYGVTSTFRDALLSLRERRLIRPDPSRRTYDISLSEALAQDYMKDAAIPPEALEELVNEIFRITPAGAPI